MMNEWVRKVRNILFKDTPVSVATQEDPDKKELERRLSEAQRRLQRLEWEADVIRRQGMSPDTAQKE